MFLGISVSVAAQRQGVGRALMNSLMDYADNWAQVLRLELNVYADNAAAIRLYERCGFILEGRLRAYALRGGEYVDSLAMARLHPNPPRLPSPQT
jgi:putative acetyltransferase